MKKLENLHWIIAKKIFATNTRILLGKLITCAKDITCSDIVVRFALITSIIPVVVSVCSADLFDKPDLSTWLFMSLTSGRKHREVWFFVHVWFMERLWKNDKHATLQKHRDFFSLTSCKIGDLNREESQTYKRIYTFFLIHTTSTHTITQSPNIQGRFWLPSKDYAIFAKPTFIKLILQYGQLVPQVDWKYRNRWSRIMEGLGSNTTFAIHFSVTKVKEQQKITYMKFSLCCLHCLPLHRSDLRGGGEGLYLDLLTCSVSSVCEHGILPLSGPGTRQGGWYTPFKKHTKIVMGKNTCNNLAIRYSYF